MSKPKNLTEMKAHMDAAKEAEAQAAANAEWNEQLNWDAAEGNPQFESLDMALEHIAEEDARKELPAPRAMAQTFEPRVGEPMADVGERITLTPLATAWADTPAPAVGVCGGDLHPSVAAFLGTYASPTNGRVAEPAAKIDVDRQANGLWIAQTERPGTAHLPPDRCQPAPGPGAQAEVLKWLTDVVDGVRGQLAGDLPLLVIVSPETGLEDQDLYDIAVAGRALAVLHRRGAPTEWQPRLLEPKAVPIVDPPAVPEPKVVRYQENMGPIQATPDAVWISRVPRAVVGYPTEIQGPRGEPVQCGYGMDPERYEVVKLTGWTESPGGAVEQMRLEVAPGCSVPLANFEVRLSESPVE